MNDLVSPDYVVLTTVQLDKKTALVGVEGAGGAAN